MVVSTQRRLLLLGGLCLAALSVWAGPRLVSTAAEPHAPSTEQPRPAVSKVARPVPEVSTLYEHATSAYHARLFADEDGVVLVTETGFTTFRAGEAPVEHAISLGPIAVRRGGSIVFWSAGRLQETSLSGEGEHELAAVPRSPRYLLASEGQLAWVQVDADTGTSLRNLSNGAAHVVYASRENVSAAVMRGSAVYWVVQAPDSSWTIRRIDLDGRQRMTPTQKGRAPAMLALGPDGVYFYAGPEQGVTKVTFDLEREDAVATHVICSPLVVSSRLVCAQVGGLFDIVNSGTAPRLLASERAGPITSMAATHERAFWVAENGNDRLIVRSVSLDER
jgi:hypothetical protein